MNDEAQAWMSGGTAFGSIVSVHSNLFYGALPGGDAFSASSSIFTSVSRSYE